MGGSRWRCQLTFSSPSTPCLEIRSQQPWPSLAFPYIWDTISTATSRTCPSHTASKMVPDLSGKFQELSRWLRTWLINLAFVGYNQDLEAAVPVKVQLVRYADKTLFEQEVLHPNPKLDRDESGWSQHQDSLPWIGSRSQKPLGSTTKNGYFNACRSPNSTCMLPNVLIIEL